jgi:excisionase family DNA binding protein
MRRETMEDRWLSVDEIAGHLGVSRDTVYRWIDHRGLPAHKVGRLWKFKKDEIDEWVRASHAEEEEEEDRDSPPRRSNKPRR